MRTDVVLQLSNIYYQHTHACYHTSNTFVTGKKIKSDSMHTLKFVLIRNVSFFFCKDLFNVVRFIYVYSVLPLCMYITCIQCPQRPEEGGHQIPLTGVGCQSTCECSCQTWVHCKSNKCSYLLSHLSISLSLFVRKCSIHLKLLGCLFYRIPCPPCQRNNHILNLITSLFDKYFYKLCDNHNNNWFHFVQVSLNFFFDNFTHNQYILIILSSPPPISPVPSTSTAASLEFLSHVHILPCDSLSSS